MTGISPDTNVLSFFREPLRKLPVTDVGSRVLLCPHNQLLYQPDFSVTHTDNRYSWQTRSLILHFSVIVGMLPLVLSLILQAEYCCIGKRTAQFTLADSCGRGKRIAHNPLVHAVLFGVSVEGSSNSSSCSSSIPTEGSGFHWIFHNLASNFQWNILFW